MHGVMRNPGMQWFFTILAGLLTAVAFAPYSVWPLSILGLAWLFRQWQAATPARAFWLGFAFGTGLFLGGVYWVYFSMHVYGHIPWPLAGLLTLVFAMFLGLFPGLCGWLANRLFPDLKQAFPWLIYPVAWTLVEWMRSWLFTGFPWLNAGASQVGSPLSAYLPVVGEYGVSLLVALSAALMISMVRSRGLSRAGGIVALVAIWLGALALQPMEWTRPAGKPIRVALVQGDIDQESKWDPQSFDSIVSHYLKLTRPYWGVDVVIWPETAIPAFYDDVRDVVDALQQLAHDQGSDMLVGIPYRNKETGQYYNSVLSLGEEQRFYHKRHLVPFGEFIPFQSSLEGLLDFMGLPMSGFSRGEAGQKPLLAGHYRAGITICYEIVFNDEVRDSLPAANYLVNVSNNTWFGDSSMPFQQLQIISMRARESGRYVASVTNNGVTALVDDRGRIVRQSPQFAANVLVGELVPRQGSTPFVRWGNGPVLTLLFACVLLGGLMQRRAAALS